MKKCVFVIYSTKANGGLNLLLKDQQRSISFAVLLPQFGTAVSSSPYHPAGSDNGATPTTAGVARSLKRSLELTDFSDTFFSKYLDRITNIRTHARDGLSMAKQGPDLEDKRSAARLAQAE